MLGEELVIGIYLHQVAGGCEQFEADEQGEKSADEKEESDLQEIKERNALVVGGEKPRADPVVLVEVILPFNVWTDRCCHSYCT
jgi:hypothetical protein